MAEGKIRRLGISECTVDELARAHATHPVSALQSEFSLWTREPLQDVIPWCADNGVVVRGLRRARPRLPDRRADAPDQEFPSGDFRATNPRFEPDAMGANMAIVDGVRRVAERLGATPAQVCVAWVLAQGEHVLPIPGTKRERYLEENVGGGTLALDAAGSGRARRAAARPSARATPESRAGSADSRGRCGLPHLTRDIRSGHRDDFCLMRRGHAPAQHQWCSNELRHPLKGADRDQPRRHPRQQRDR